LKIKHIYIGLIVFSLALLPSLASAHGERRGYHSDDSYCANLQYFVAGRDEYCYKVFRSIYPSRWGYRVGEKGEFPIILFNVGKIDKNDADKIKFYRDRTIEVFDQIRRSGVYRIRSLDGRWFYVEDVISEKDITFFVRNNEGVVITTPPD
jgi:hypothetical protein